LKPVRKEKHVANYDAIVLGIGGVGSAAALHLARRGARVLGLDRFAPGHDRGSSHGQTRLIRQAYYEHPHYVPLVRRAFELWRDLEHMTGKTLYHQIGLLQIGPEDGEVVRGVRASAHEHDLPVEEYSASESRRRFPAFELAESFRAVYEARAGYLLVEDCVRAHAQQARAAGMELRVGDTIRSWRADSGGVVVETDGGSFRAGRLVIAVGAWASQLLGELGVPFEVRRKPLYWFEASDPAMRADQGCPAFLYDLPQGCFYGVPRIDELGIKVAQHTGGRVVLDPLALDRELDAEDEREVAQFVADYLPRASTHRTAHAVCMYTMTPDCHFVVDRHPEHPQVVFAAGLSGHGFKFTSVLGEALADLALAGETNLPIGFLSLDRPGLRQNR
jgi:sarcosine oxidase